MFKGKSLLGFMVIGFVFSVGFTGLMTNEAGAQVNESVGWGPADRNHYKFCDGEVDPWTQKIQGNGSVSYECNGVGGVSDCELVVVTTANICGGQVHYDCTDGAEVTLLSNGVLLVPNACEGDCGCCNAGVD